LFVSGGSGFKRFGGAARTSPPVSGCFSTFHAVAGCPQWPFPTPFIMRAMKTDQTNRTNPPQHLAALSEQPPASGTGKVIWAWPWISTALARGWGVRDIWRALEADGLAIPYDQFRVYVSRVRKRMAQQQKREQQQAQPSTPLAQQFRAAMLQTPPLPPQPRSAAPLTPPPDQPAQPPVHDPYVGAREQRRLKNASSFEFDPFSTNKNLLE